jgi:predicted nucleic acid-binding protein
MTIRSPKLVVMDASAVVAMLADDGGAGEWAAAYVTGARLAAPDLMPYEAANILRRHVLAGNLDASAAALAHGDLTALPCDLYPYAALADRAWELRGNVTIYDAAYVALAELMEAPLLTLDARLARAPGPLCSIVAYEEEPA